MRLSFGTQAAALLAIFVVACGSGSTAAQSPTARASSDDAALENAASSQKGATDGGARGDAAANPNRPFTIAIVGTNDLHGRIEALPILGGFMSALRKKEGADHVLLVDAGDMFQGTLESNMSEGAAVIRAYNVLGYDAAGDRKSRVRLWSRRAKRNAARRVR